MITQRYRHTDPDTSIAASAHAYGDTAASHRKTIFEAVTLHRHLGITAKELANVTGIEYHATARRLSEIEGITRLPDKRDGCYAWTTVQEAANGKWAKVPERIYFDGKEFHA